ncbi:hypothetical protein H696_03093 [Fonticula alba]|uniref:LisH domain-containing protein n=1 Tax=Fonticula alba TaxID=691883 RepID=A0A058ZBD9_FONAL|nr:hypothetical protein H696_03093 [Fonticula alba]KCV70742.1 hypothetical protein H696_03093 [Fonticula alba]|eukprot:XP_009495258.1 hypothetical protein H696_03093 [Fonticula alba]
MNVPWALATNQPPLLPPDPLAPSRLRLPSPFPSFSSRAFLSFPREVPRHPADTTDARFFSSQGPSAASAQVRDSPQGRTAAAVLTPTAKADAVVRQYLLERGFSDALKYFDKELSTDRDLAFCGRRLADHLLSFVTELDYRGLLQEWDAILRRIMASSMSAGSHVRSDSRGLGTNVAGAGLGASAPGNPHHSGGAPLPGGTGMAGLSAGLSAGATAGLQAPSTGGNLSGPHSTALHVQNFKFIRVCLVRLLLVRAIRLDQRSVALDFLSACSVDGTGASSGLFGFEFSGDEWLRWFSLPLMKNPHLDGYFRVYFSKEWEQKFNVSLVNSLSTIMASMQKPQLVELINRTENLATLQEHAALQEDRLRALQAEVTRLQGALAQADSQLRERTSRISSLEQELLAVVGIASRPMLTSPLTSIMTSPDSGLSASGQFDPAPGVAESSTGASQPVRPGPSTPAPTGGVSSTSVTPEHVPSEGPGSLATGSPSGEFSAPGDNGSRGSPTVSGLTRGLIASRSCTGELSNVSSPLRDEFHMPASSCIDVSPISLMAMRSDVSSLDLPSQGSPPSGSLVTPELSIPSVLSGSLKTAVQFLKYSPDGLNLLSATVKGEVNIHRFGRMILSTPTKVSSSIESLAWMPDSSGILFSPSNTSICHQSMSSLSGLPTQNDQTTRIFSLDNSSSTVSFLAPKPFSSSHCYAILTSSAGPSSRSYHSGEILAFDVASQKTLHSIKLENFATPTCLSFNQNGNLMLVGDTTGSVHMFDIRSQRSAIQVLPVSLAPISLTHFSPGEVSIMSVDRDGQLARSTNGRTIETPLKLGDMGNNPCLGLFSFSPNADNLASIHVQGNGNIFSTQDGRLVTPLPLSGQYCSAVDWSPTCDSSLRPTLAVGTVNGNVFEWGDGKF